ncbi:MAG: serine protease [Burkholderiales bacterium]|nr:serine protease [Burkholderiales bacterium]
MKLSNRTFVVATITLIALNLFVYLWWANRPFVVLRPADVNREIVAGLEAEGLRIQAMLDSACTSPELLAYRRGEVGPVQRTLPQAGIPSSPDASGVSVPVQNAPTQNPPVPAQGAQGTQGTQGITAPSQTTTSMLTQEQLVALLEAATVRVLVFSDQMKYLGHGTGFFIDKNTVVTNRHVIEAGKRFAITSSFLGKEPLPARLIAATRDSEYTNPDFAVLRAEKVPANVRALALSTQPKLLQTVVASGFPSSEIRVDANLVTPNTVFSQGEVSVLQPQPNNMVLVLHTARIATGSSGGPLVNRCGNVVGVNTFIGAQTDKFSDRSLYALSGNALRIFLDQSGVSYTKIPNDCSSEPKN